MPGMRIGYFLSSEECSPATLVEQVDEVYVSNMGPHHRQFFDLYRDEVLPRLRA